MTPIAAHPKYLDAKQCVDTLNAALAKIDVRLVEIARDMPAPSADRDAAQIEAALKFAATGEVRAPANASRGLTEESQMLSEQRGALVKEIGVRIARLDFVAASLSVEVRAELAPAHKKLAALMADHLQSVADVLAKEVAMFGDLDAAGYGVKFTECLAWPLVQDDNLLGRKIHELRLYAGWK